nr:hypothetical protein [Chloroflexia bacterium]
RTPIAAYPDTLNADAAAYRRFAEALLAEGVHVIPRGLLYVSAAHGEPELTRTREAVGRAAARLTKHSPPIEASVT